MTRTMRVQVFRTIYPQDDHQLILRCFGEREGFNNKLREIHHLQMSPQPGSGGGRITLAIAYINTKKREHEITADENIIKGFPAHIAFEVSFIVQLCAGVNYPLSRSKVYLQTVPLHWGLGNGVLLMAAPSFCWPPTCMKGRWRYHH
jgi:hypothetical protein